MLPLALSAESGLDVTYAQLTNALHQRAAAVGQPLNGAFELTSRCNLACRMCYVRRPAGDSAAKRSELSARQWVELAEQAAANGMLFLLLTGGEAFLRPDFLDIYEPLTHMGLSITLYSNGTLVTPELARALGRRPPNRMEVTLYGAAPETYARITGSASAFASALRGITLLRDAGLTMALKFTITRSNVREHDAVREIAQRLELPLKPAWLLSSRVDGEPCDAAAERLSATEVVDLEQADAATRERWSASITESVSLECVDPMYCLAGKASFAINPRGEMSPCIDLPMPAARPLEVGFGAAWDQVREFVRRVPCPPECASCNLRAWCPSCPARAFVETRALDGVDRYSCEIARARRAAFQARREARCTS